MTRNEFLLSATLQK